MRLKVAFTTVFASRKSPTMYKYLHKVRGSGIQNEGFDSVQSLQASRPVCVLTKIVKLLSLSRFAAHPIRVARMAAARKMYQFP